MREGRQPHRNSHAWKEEVGGCVDRVDRDVHDVPHVASVARGEEQCVACTELAEAGGGGRSAGKSKAGAAGLLSAGKRTAADALTLTQTLG